MEPELSGAQAVAVGQAPGKESPAARVLKNRNFRLLWLGQGTSLIGDQFYMIALPWLVLLMTGDPAQLGLVLALTGVPRVALMLFGGALSDRFSQRSVMLVSDVIRLAMTAGLAAMVFTGGMQMWMIYLFAFAFGAVSGIFIPASQSMVPRIVGREELMVGNTIEQITSQMSVFVGPLLAGALIAWLAGSSTASTGGIGVAFAVDSFTFLVSVATLAMMKVGTVPAAGQKGIMSSISEGITFVAQSRVILEMFLIMALINFLFTGPLIVGMPVLAKYRLAGGAADYGLLMAAFAFGTLLGAIATSVVKVRPANLGLVSAGCIAVFGIGLAAMGMISLTWEGMAILFVIGLLNGYTGVVLVTLLQKRTPPEMMGRLMSLVMIAGMGLVPVSQALAGFAMSVSIGGVFVVCGLLIVLIAAAAMLSGDVRNFGLELHESR